MKEKITSNTKVGKGYKIQIEKQTEKMKKDELIQNIS